MSAAAETRRGGRLSSCRVHMGSGDTACYHRDERLLVPWFYVTVPLDLERP